MAKKKHFIRYLESRNDLLCHSSRTLVIRRTFTAGCPVSRFSGFDTKRDCLATIESINTAAGKTITVYAGSYVPPTGMETVWLPDDTTAAV